jgi:hypothetical protein
MDLKIAVERVRLLLEHEVDVFPVTVESKHGVWEETAASEHDLRTFLQGLEAGCAMCGQFISLPDMPTEPTKKLS